MDERRQLPRWEIKKESKVLMQGEITNTNHCIIEDIHLKGMCVSFSKWVPLQEAGSMSFTIGDNSDFIEIEAQVPWVKEDQGRYVYGLSFNKIADEDKDRIYQYITTNCFDQFKDKWWA